MTPATTLSSTGPTAGILPDRRRILALAAVFALVLLLVPLASANRASAQVAQGTAVSVGPIYPSLVIVGQTGVAAQLSIVNNSTGVGPLTLTQITLNPACQDGLCAVPDLGVLQLSATGLGVAGACNGVAFTITPGVDGNTVFTPTAPIILAEPTLINLLDTCLINYSFNVLKAPVLDADTAVGSIGLQTIGYATVTGYADTILLERLPAAGSGATITTVGLRETALTTRASGAVAIGQQIRDTATLTGGFNPTGTITFTLFGPDNTECAGPPIFTSSIPVTANGDYLSALFTPTLAGTYRWVALYSGDANNGFAGPTACNDALEAVLVSQVTTTLPPVTTTLPPGVTTTLPPDVLPFTTVPPSPLVRTGSSLMPLAAVAALLLVLGAHLLVESVRRRGDGFRWPTG